MSKSRYNSRYGEKSIMVRRLSFVLATIFVGSAASGADEALHFPPLGIELPIVSLESDVPKFLGRVVILRGTISNSKQPTICGVAVNPQSISKKQQWAMGILGRTRTKVETEGQSDFAPSKILSNPGIASPSNTDTFPPVRSPDGYRLYAIGEGTAPVFSTQESLLQSMDTRRQKGEPETTKSKTNISEKHLKPEADGRERGERSD